MSILSCAMRWIKYRLVIGCEPNELLLSQSRGEKIYWLQKLRRESGPQPNGMLSYPSMGLPVRPCVSIVGVPAQLE
jgi:hypothetical protein